MANRVLILRWAGSAYDSLGGLSELMAGEFAAFGPETAVFAAEGADWPQRLIYTLKQGGIAFALTMSGIGVEVTDGDKLVWDIVKIPLFNWNCDHPCYFPERHCVRSPYVLHGHVFPDHARYSLRHLNPNGAAFAVHMGIPPRAIFPQAPLPLTSRNGRLMFAKSGVDTNEIEATWRGYDPIARQIVFAAAEELSSRSTSDYLPGLQRIAESHGLLLSGDNRLALLLIREIDAYIRAGRGNLVMRSILHYPVDVFGSGWDHIGADGTVARFHGAVTWRNMVEQTPSYIGCLSVNPLVDESAHDRVFFALAAGVAPVSDWNSFLATNMPDLEPYSFTFTPETIGQAVEAVLAQPSEAVMRTDSTWQALGTRFGMRRSSQLIAQFAALHALNAPCGSLRI